MSRSELVALLRKPIEAYGWVTVWPGNDGSYLKLNKAQLIRDVIEWGHDDIAAEVRDGALYIN